MNRSHHGLLVTFLLLICLGAAAAERLAPPDTAGVPRLILVISIDQMRYDYLTRFAPLYKGGFKTLLDHGAVFTNAMYRHSNCETGPGHSVILSGRHASHSGIVANSWYDSLLKKEVNVVDDPAQRPVGGPGRSASPTHFIGFTVGDKIKQKWPGSRVVGVSMKDRAAILLAGHRGDAAYWFENACGCFITSSYYMAQPPAWLTEFNSRKLADSYFPTPWTKLYPDNSLYLKYSREDNFPGEWDLKDTTFPHQHRGRPGQAAYYDNLRRTPFADELVLKAALEAMQFHDLGTRSTPDVLAVGFSAGDIIGHTYGPFSQEQMDNYLRLDLTLGKLIEAAEARAGAGNTLVVLAADHGALPLVEWLRHEGNKAAKRVSLKTVLGAVQAALQSRFPGAPNLIAGNESLNITLNEEAIQKAGLRRSDVEQTAIKALMASGAVAKVYTRADLLSDKPGSDPYEWLFRNSFFEPRSPDLMVRVKEYTYVSNFPGGTGHGTAYDYDRHIPIVFMGAGIPPGRYSRSVGPEDIAPTLAHMLGIHDYPMESDSRLLAEVLGSATNTGSATGR